MNPEVPSKVCAEALARVQPALEQIFAAYGVSEAEAHEMIETACEILVSLRPENLRSPEGLLVRTVVEMCLSIFGEEADEDPSE